jgi:hypothetical protein
VVLLGAAAGAFAVAQRTQAPATVRVQAGAHGIAAVSPHALYVAAGLGDALVALAPDGTRAWSHRTRGPVAAIAWAPSGLRIAYVVRVGARFELRLIEGDGDHDELVDATVRPARPTWSRDSLAIVYVGAGGARTRYDLAHRTHRVLG